jgi:hypothetical protein
VLKVKYWISWIFRQKDIMSNRKCPPWLTTWTGQSWCWRDNGNSGCPSQIGGWRGKMVQFSQNFLFVGCLGGWGYVNRRDAKCSLPVELRNGIVVHGGAVVTLVRARKKIKKIDVWLRKERVKQRPGNYDSVILAFCCKTSNHTKLLFARKSEMNADCCSPLSTRSNLHSPRLRL